MRRISTGIEQLLTEDSVADAVISYATALARASTADTVTIPIVDQHGRANDARLLLGPSSQLTIVPDDDSVETALPGADEVVRDLEQRTRRLGPAATIEQDPQEDPVSGFSDFDQFG